HHRIAGGTCAGGRRGRGLRRASLRGCRGLGGGDALALHAEALAAAQAGGVGGQGGGQRGEGGGDDGGDEELHVRLRTALGGRGAPLDGGATFAPADQ